MKFSKKKDTFPDKQKLKNYANSKLIFQKMLEEVLQVEMKGC